jgi:hypothetical protein
MRVEATSPRSFAAARSAVIMRVSRPRRRWVAVTVTAVTAFEARKAPPGAVSCWSKLRYVAT